MGVVESRHLFGDIITREANLLDTELRQHHCRLYELCDGLLFISTQLKNNESTDAAGLHFLLQLLHDEMTKTLIEVDKIL